MLYWILGGVGVLALAVFIGVLAARRRRAAGPVSVVLLRSSHRSLTPSEVRSAYRRAYSREPDVREPFPGQQVPQTYVLLAEGMPNLAVLSCDGAYLAPEEAEKAAGSIESEIVRRALREHRAWISVDAFGAGGLNRGLRARVHALLAKLAAELYDDGCVLLFLPAEDQVAAPGENVVAMLREGRIAELFGDHELHAPMFGVADDDAEIERAIEEARRRLPEFLGAFERRSSSEPFLFKARFVTSSGGIEVLWLSLVEVRRDGLVGIIQNPPVAKNIPRKGERATCPLDHVVDWVYADEQGQGQGLFVDTILLKRRGRA